MDETSDASHESIYYSCLEDFFSDSDSDSDEEPDLNSAPSCFLGSTTTSASFRSGSNAVSLLVCLNAARILLAEIASPKGRAGSLDPFKGEQILKRILAICHGWNGLVDERFISIVALPIFQASLSLRKFERRYCSHQNISDFVMQLQDGPSAAVVTGQNDALTIVSTSSWFGRKPSSHLVFNPRCRASLDLGSASLRFFLTAEEAFLHVYNVISIHRGDESSAPQYAYAGYMFGPKSANNTSPRQEVDSHYQSNIRLLERTLQLKRMRIRENASRHEIGSLQTATEIELQAEKATLERRDTNLAEATSLEIDLAAAQEFAAAMLEFWPNGSSRSSLMPIL